MILVTGATGFVGRRLIRLLADAYGAANITCLVYDQADNELEQSGRAILTGLAIRQIAVDLVSGRGLGAAPKSPAIVIHVASNTDTGATDHRINDVGTRNLLEAIRPLRADTHFIFTSTIAVSDHRSDYAAPVDETTAVLRPFNDYGRRKLAAEDYLREQSRVEGFRVTVVRLCAVFGRGTRQSGLFDQLARMVRRDSLVARLNFPGLLSFIHVEDIAGILVRLSREPRTSSGFELYIPVAEVMTIEELIRCYYDAYAKEYRQLRLPDAFWKLCAMAAFIFYRLEPVLPHFISNRLWQLGLVVGRGFYNRGTRIFERFPDLRLRKFRDAAKEMIGQ